MVEMHPPPNFHAAAPASIPLNGPSIDFLPGDIETLKTYVAFLGKLSAKISVPSLETSAVIVRPVAAHDLDTKPGPRACSNSYQSLAPFQMK